MSLPWDLGQGRLGRIRHAGSLCMSYRLLEVEDGEWAFQAKHATDEIWQTVRRYPR